MITFDSAGGFTVNGRYHTRDSTGSFLIGQLEKLDLSLNEPLVNISWSRDIDLRDDVSIAMESASWTNSAFAANGGIQPNGKAWVGADSNAIATIALDIGKTNQPLLPWAMELGYTLFELASAIQLGQPVDLQKLEGLKLKYQMDIDEMVYIGDTLLGYNGLVNNTTGPTAVTPSNVPAGASGFTQWAKKTPDEILADVNEILTTTWSVNSAMAVVPGKLLVPPAQFAYLVQTKISALGSISVLSYLRQNSIALELLGRMLDIKPVKWLTGAGAGGTDRMCAYSQDPKYLRFPLVPLQRAGPLEYRSLWQLMTYASRLGVVEFRYPETIGYRDGI